MIGNCVCCSIYVLLQKKWVFSKEAGTTSSYLSKKWSKYPINLTAWTYLFGALFMLLHAIILIIENCSSGEKNIKPNNGFEPIAFDYKTRALTN